MPWTAVKKGNKVLIKKKTTGEVVGHSDSMDKAMASIKARYMAESGKKMKSNDHDED